MRQSFTWWSFTLTDPPDDVGAFLQAASDIGFEGVEMLPPEHASTAAGAGLQLVTATGHEIEHGFNDPARHAELHETVGSAIEEASAAGVANVIVFSGNHIGDDDDTAIAHCAAGLAPLVEQAERSGVTLLLELLNSKVDHPGYQCDRSEWGFEVIRTVDSPSLRVLFDVYHMQLMEGDLLRTLKANLALVGHIHTAGVPGRRDLDDRQEIHWPGLAGLLVHLGYDGWVGHEFMPRGDALDALAQAHAIFDRR
ncbi:MAG: TIM barrel protein [Acidobacteria bacterium]|nr:TIM barrel protein [Acidobacteriota bacterium]